MKIIITGIVILGSLFLAGIYPHLAVGFTATAIVLIFSLLKE